jgi:NAD(P)-dependent dehydrogenase (short-subunit alcohol dehydrogenase family)
MSKTESILKNKIIVVTGGSGLIGNSIISDIKMNAGTTINLDNSVEDDLSLGEINCDITCDKSLKIAIERILEKYGKIDGLVNNAYPRTSDWGTPFREITLNSINKNIEYQLTSYIRTSQLILNHMENNKSGAIINVASIYGIVGNDYSIYQDTGINPPAIYSAIKGGIINFTRHLAAKYGPLGIRINSISPGGIFDNQNKLFVERYSNRVPMRRMGSPEDISPSVSFLLSEKAKYITGQNLVIDGGWTII